MKDFKKQKYNSITLIETLLYIGLFAFFIFMITSIFIMVNNVKTHSQVIEDVNLQGKRILFEITKEIRSAENIVIIDEVLHLDNIRFELENGVLYFQEVGEDRIEFTSNRVFIEEFNIQEVSRSTSGDLVNIEVLVSSNSPKFNHSIRFYGAGYSRN